MMPANLMQNWGWSVAVCFSLFLHIIIAWGVMTYQQSNVVESGAADIGEHGLEVGLGRVGTYTEMAKSILQKVEQTMDVQAKPLAVKQSPAPEKVVIKVPVTKIKIKQVQSQKKLKAKGDYALLAKAESIEHEGKKTMDKPTVKNAKIETQEAKSAPFDSASRATGVAKDRTTGGKKGTAKKYFSQLMAWLNKHKAYPVQAKKEKQQGTVTLKFSINQQGFVLDKSIVKSSGYALLDQSAMQMLVDAQPLPQPPANLKRDRLVLQIPIEFSLITNKLLRK